MYRYLFLVACGVSSTPHQDAIEPYDPTQMESPLMAAPSNELVAQQRVVFGYLPYWVSADTVVHWDLITHLAYFSAALRADLSWSPETSVRLSGARFSALRDDAKAHGVKLVLTVTNFTKSEISTLVGPKRAQSVAAIVRLAQEAQVQGVNIDFEFVPLASANDFVDFMDALTQAMHAAIPGSHVSFASGSSSQGGAYDFPRLLQVTDAVMVMFYGCHYSGGSTAGPLAPLTRGTEWSASCNLQSVVSYFAVRVPLSKVIMGLPFYGYQWATESSSLGAQTMAKGQARVWTACKRQYAQTSRSWDDNSQTPWTTFVDGATRYQLWCDDGESMQLKVDHLTQKSVGGIGIWALGYEGTEMEYWTAIRPFISASMTPSPDPVAPTGVVSPSGEEEPPVGNNDIEPEPETTPAPPPVSPVVSMGRSEAPAQGCGASGAPWWFFVALFVRRFAARNHRFD